MKALFLLMLLPVLASAQNFTSQEKDRYAAQAKNVTIIRDTWGIPHIYGKTDADAVFGLMYAQCEENFARVERNYLEIMGRLGEVDGKNQLYTDLEMRLIYDSADAIKDYQKSPAWFQKLLNAFADGINFYLVKNPGTKPAVLKRFEPWFPLLYTDGSIAPTQTGGLNMQDLRALYAPKDSASLSMVTKRNYYDDDPSGSNGFAIGPSKSASKNALLYINPHVTFYFRTEVQMVSEEGLNAYGAVTWGQFFVYQGFNQHCGWMHTSSYADVADLYEEKISVKGDSLFYLFDGKLMPVRSKKITINYIAGGNLEQKEFTTYATHHGPVMGKRNNTWLSLKENNRSLAALMQSWLRTKAAGFDEFKKIMDMRSNNSNNTVFADDKGNIAYWHGNFMPRRDPAIDWTLPVDGSSSATDWKGVHALDEIVHLYNPKNGWIQNCNSTPFTAAGASSPKKEDYPTYMAPDGQNPRAVNAVRLLSKAENLTLDKLIELGYNKFLSAFDILLPPLFAAYDQLPQNDSLKKKLAEPIALIKKWDKYSSISSIPATLAIEWAYKLSAKIAAPKTPEAASNGIGQLNKMAALADREKLKLLTETINELTVRFGTWKTPWGEVNRYQRVGVNQAFDDAQPSMAVGQAAATWGALPSFATRRMPNTNKRYGVSGNSFIAAVEFGKKVKAKTIVTGGQSNDPQSKHFLDQAPLYIEGKFKDVFFYKEDVLKHVERQYHPGE
jgi:acyl-homoserine-lactone acylase